MVTEVIKVNTAQSGADVARRAADVLMKGGLVVFPTETVYGVGARADRPEAVYRLRELKERDATRPFTVHIGSRACVSDFAPDIPGVASRLIRKAWPGPLTLVLSVKDPSATVVAARLNGTSAAIIYHEHSVGLRFPDDVMAGALLRMADAPIVAASANRAGRPPPLSGDDALRELDGRVDLLVDAGPTKYNKPSTIVRMTETGYNLIREGVYDAAVIERLSQLRILIVCTGNTCRSPMAAALARVMLAARLGCAVPELPHRGVHVMSAGTSAGVGAASPHAVQVMQRRGIDLTDHVSSRLSADMIQQADYVYAMTRAHRETILELVPSAAERVALLLDDRDVQDPVGGGEDTYERCAETVAEGLQRRLQEVIV